MCGISIGINGVAGTVHFYARSYARIIYSNKKKETSDIHGTVYFDPVKKAQRKTSQNVYQASDTSQMVII